MSHRQSGENSMDRLYIIYQHEASERQKQAQREQVAREAAKQNRRKRRR
jgi:hypothetical protein